MSMRSDVGPMIDAWQGQAPMAYVSTGTVPDEANLAAWMEKMFFSAGGLKLTRSADPLWDRTVAWLKSEGVDVPRAFASVDREHEYAANRTREAADRARHLALDLKAAEKRLLFEARGVRDGAAGFTRAGLAEAQGRVNDLAAALVAACVDDPVLARQVRRSVA